MFLKKQELGSRISLDFSIFDSSNVSVFKVHSNVDILFSVNLISILGATLIYMNVSNLIVKNYLQGVSTRLFGPAVSPFYKVNSSLTSGFATFIQALNEVILSGVLVSVFLDIKVKTMLQRISTNIVIHSFDKTGTLFVRNTVKCINSITGMVDDTLNRVSRWS